MIHLSACTVKFNKESPRVDCVAVLEAPGMSSVITFIMPDGKPYKGRRVWSYDLWPSKGAISIECTE